MFFGRIVSSKNPFVFSAEEVDETVGDVICISNVALAPTSNEDAILIAKKDGKQFVVAALNHKNPQVALNFYIQIGQYVEFLVRGKGFVHIIGFFQPEPKFDHLDQVQLLHKHEHEHQLQEKSQHKHQVQQETPQQPTKLPREQKVILPEEQTTKHRPLKEKSKYVQNFIQSLQPQQDGLEDEEDQDSESDNSEDIEDQDEGDLKGLDDIDDDIGDGAQPNKAKPQANKSGQPNSKQTQPNAGKKSQAQSKPKAPEQQKPQHSLPPTQKQTQPQKSNQTPKNPTPAPTAQKKPNPSSQQVGQAPKLSPSTMEPRQSKKEKKNRKKKNKLAQQNQNKNQ